MDFPGARVPLGTRNRFLFYFKPAPGYRDFGRSRYEGVTRGIGNNGYSWAFTTSGTYGMFLDFYVQNLNPSDAGGHGHGFQLRCLSE